MLDGLDVEEYLKSKGLEVFKTYGKELTMQCVFCGESHRKGKLYVNSVSFAWDCKVCGAQGGYRKMMEHFGDSADLPEASEVVKSSRTLQLNEDYLKVAEEALANSPDVMDYLKGRGLSEATIKEFRFGYHPIKWSFMERIGVGVQGGYKRQEARDAGLLTDHGNEFLQGRIIIPYLSSGQVVQLRGRAWDKETFGAKYISTPGSRVQLYNRDALRGAELVWLAEGEFDGALLHQHLKYAPDVKARRFAVVALAGAESLPDGREQFQLYMAGAKRVYVAMDSDDTGRRAALKLKDLLGSKARILEYTKAGDATDFLEGRNWEDLMRLVTETDARNKRLFNLEEAAAKAQALKEAGPGIKLGWRTVDALIAPGVYPGAVVVPMAKTGVGKTLILQSIAYHNRHLPILFVSLELTAPELWDRMLRNLRFYHPEMTIREHKRVFPKMLIMEENRLNAGTLSQIIDEFTEEIGEPPQLIMVDYLQYAARRFPGNSSQERTASAIMELKEVAKEAGAALFVPSQVSRASAKDGEPIDVDSGRDSGVIEETADFLLSFWRPWEAGAVTGGSTAVQSELITRILKSRRGNKGRQVTLHQSHVSLVIVDPSDRKNVNRVEQENNHHNQGVPYDTIWQADHRREVAKMQQEMLTEGGDVKAPWEIG